MRYWLLLFSCLFASVSLSVSASVSLADILDNTKKMATAASIQDEYTSKLKLEGKTTREAIEQMVGVGFKCGFRPDDSTAFMRRTPAVACLKYPSNIAEGCETLDILIIPDWLVPGVDSAGLLKKLTPLALKELKRYAFISRLVQRNI